MTALNSATSRMARLPTMIGFDDPHLRRAAACANGNMTTDQAGNTLVYDAWNRLVEARDGSTTLQRYEYDALNRRIEADGVKFFHAAQWQVLEERDATTDAVTTQYVWSPVYVDAMVLRDRDANASAGDGLEERLYATHDANFNITALIDTAGDVVERFLYDPYGQATVLDANWAVDVDGTSDFAWQYLHQGGRFDFDARLYHFRHRDYSPTLGRWVQQDPLSYIDGMGRYQANLSNPLTYTDDLGLMPNRDDAVTLEQFIQKIRAIEAEPQNAQKGACEILKIAADAAMKDWKQAGDPWPYLHVTGVRGGWLDLPHFLKGADASMRIMEAMRERAGMLAIVMEGRFQTAGDLAVHYGGIAQELRQVVAGLLYSSVGSFWGIDKLLEGWGMWPSDESSAFTPEDIISNDMGAFFGSRICECGDNANRTKLSDQLEAFLRRLGAADPQTAPNWDRLPSSEAEWQSIDENDKFRAWLMRWFF